MRVITICQPYASLIANPPHEKRVENRSWETLYRGPIGIHAGSSRKWLQTWDGPMPSPMPFSGIVAVANLAACLHLDSWLADPKDVRGVTGEELTRIMLGQHASGPFCWILTDIRRLAEPYQISGQQGLWHIDISAEKKFKFESQTETIA